MDHRNTTATVATPADPPSNVRHGDDVKDDDEDLALGPARAFSIAVAGAVKVTLLDDTTHTYASGEIPVGVQWSGWFKRLWSTGTTATGINVYW